MLAPTYVDRNLDAAHYRKICKVNHYHRLEELKMLTDVRHITKSQERQINKIKHIRNKVSEFELAGKLRS